MLEIITPDGKINTMPAQKQNETLKILAITAVCVLTAVLATQKTYAVDCGDISDLDDRAKCYADKIKSKENEYQSTTKKLADLTKTRDSISKQLTDLKSNLNVTTEQINELQDQINQVEKALAEINSNLSDRRGKLGDKINLRDKILRNYAKRSHMNLLETFLSDTSLGLGYLNKSISTNIIEEIIKIIGGLNSEINTFEQDKADAETLKNDLQTDTARLAQIRADLDARKNQTQSDLAKVQDQEKATSNKLKNLQAEISALSAKQQEILKAKAGEGTGSVGDYDTPTSKTPEPPFKPAIALFSYGAYTHYNGMSQYGAKGRADKGQSYKEILKFYYKTDTTEKDDFPSKINVQGYGEIDFQYYLYGLAEMPTSWPIEALKAQAIAGRTYAYRSNKPICTTESCQVFSKSKADAVKNGQYDTWKKAVDDTKKEILNGTGTSQYSSTTGGYINNVGWDTNGKWPNDAYEKLAGSPWFYKAWYIKGYTGSDSCGRGHPWLSQKEMADILNSWVVWNNGTDGDEKHISPVTTNCWGGDPYSLDEMAEKAEKYGTKYSQVTGVDVDISNSGYTSKVYLTTDKGKVEIDGQTFRTVFNLRAPGYIAAKSKLFDLEYRN